MRRVARVLGAIVLVVAPLLFTWGPTSAQSSQCPPPGDFLTGGGFIVNATGTTPGEKANFGVGGGCKEGGDGHGLWGHMEYIDHGIDLHVHWTTITAYMNDSPGSDPNARIICGTATTNNPSPSIPSTVNFAVRAADDDQSGGIDKFDIQLTDPASSNAVVYTTNSNLAGAPHTLAGGNIVLHPPNPSITGSFSESCPALGGLIM